MEVLWRGSDRSAEERIEEGLHVKDSRSVPNPDLRRRRRKCVHGRCEEERGGHDRRGPAQAVLMLNGCGEQWGVLVLDGWGVAGCARVLERGKSRCIDRERGKKRKDEEKKNKKL